MLLKVAGKMLPSCICMSPDHLDLSKQARLTRVPEFELGSLLDRGFGLQEGGAASSGILVEQPANAAPCQPTW